MKIEKIVKNVIGKYDPMCLISNGCDFSEYDKDIVEISYRLRRKKDPHEYIMIVKDVFSNSYGNNYIKSKFSNIVNVGLKIYSEVKG